MFFNIGNVWYNRDQIVSVTVVNISGGYYVAVLMSGDTSYINFTYGFSIQNDALAAARKFVLGEQVTLNV